MLPVIQIVHSEMECHYFLFVD